MRKQDPFDMLTMVMVGGSDFAHDTLGAAEQDSMCNSMELPAIGSIETRYGGKTCEDRLVFEGWGIVFGDKTDELFVKATVPEGWTKVRTDHYMWSNLADDKGQFRASIMYKPEFYDRDAGITPMKKYNPTTKFFRGPDNQSDYSRVKAVIEDSNNTIIWESDYYKLSADFDSKGRQEILDKATAWLNEHYPNWQDYNAYW